MKCGLRDVLVRLKCGKRECSISSYDVSIVRGVCKVLFCYKKLETAQTSG